MRPTSDSLRKAPRIAHCQREQEGYFVNRRTKRLSAVAATGLAVVGLTTVIPATTSQASEQPSTEVVPAAAAQMAGPYVYPGWGSPPPPDTVTAIGVKSFTMAFVLANGCNPVWDGESGLTGGVHAQWIEAARAAGATVTPSVSGWQGNKLGPACSTPEALACAYQKVIDTFGVNSLDIDIENTDEFQNEAVADRIVGALKIVEQKNPGITSILTFGTTPTGPSEWGVRLIKQTKALGAPIDIYTQMPFDYDTASPDIYRDTVNSTEALKDQLKATFGWSDAEAYRHIGISGMNGISDAKRPPPPRHGRRFATTRRARAWPG
jgi:chitinase